MREELDEEITNDCLANTVDMYYVGFKRPGGALYAACLDCELSVEQQQFQEINAHDPSNKSNDSTPVCRTVYELLSRLIFAKCLGRIVLLSESQCIDFACSECS